jgi:hypothetical protein
MIGLAALLVDPLKVEVFSPKSIPSMLEAIAAFAWPVVTLILLCLYRKPISAALITISNRATEIGIGSWASIKLPEVKEVYPGPVNVIQELKSDMWMESSSQWFEGFSNSSTVSEYALLDLGDGKAWISSRLYIFAVMLQRMKSLKCIVFVRTSQLGKRQFLGCATPESVRWTLAVDQPWLEAAFAHAYAMLFPADPVIDSIARGSSITRLDGSLDPQVAMNVVRTFIFSLKNPPANIAAIYSPDWVNVGKGFEHATWLSGEELQRIIGTALWKDAVQACSSDSPEARKSQIKSIAAKSAPYVAVLKDDEYNMLVSRIALLSEIGQATA